MTKLSDQEIISRLADALRKYADGSAYDFDRSIRGEVHFNMALSRVTAIEALKDLGLEVRG